MPDAAPSPEELARLLGRVRSGLGTPETSRLTLSDAVAAENDRRKGRDRSLLALSGPRTGDR
jgi:hypothetical protein